MTPERLADWIGAIRQADPSLSLAAVEILLRVAAGADSARDLQEAIPGVDRSTLTRSLGILRGRATLHGKRWRESPIQLLQARPHPHIPGALHYGLSPNGQEIVGLLQGDRTTSHAHRNNIE
jgi:DNA-binding HxlR family transcriptional regulator